MSRKINHLNNYTNLVILPFTPIIAYNEGENAFWSFLIFGAVAFVLWIKS